MSGGAALRRDVAATSSKVMLRGFVFGFGGIVVLALLPLVARDLVEGGPLTYGILLGCFGVGAIGGALLSARLRERCRPRRSCGGLRRLRRLRCRGLGAAAAIAWLIGAGLRSAAPAGCWRCRCSTSRCSCPRRAGCVGRALSLYQTATFGGMALGTWLWGSVAEALRHRRRRCSRPPAR